MSCEVDIEGAPQIPTTLEVGTSNKRSYTPVDLAAASGFANDGKDVWLRRRLAQEIVALRERRSALERRLSLEAEKQRKFDRLLRVKARHDYLSHLSTEYARLVLDFRDMVRGARAVNWKRRKAVRETEIFSLQGHALQLLVELRGVTDADLGQQKNLKPSEYAARADRLLLRARLRHVVPETRNALLLEEGSANATTITGTGVIFGLRVRFSLDRLSDVAQAGAARWCPESKYATDTWERTFFLAKEDILEDVYALSIHAREPPGASGAGQEAGGSGTANARRTVLCLEDDRMEQLPSERATGHVHCDKWLISSNYSDDKVGAQSGEDAGDGDGTPPSTGPGGLAFNARGVNDSRLLVSTGARPGGTGVQTDDGVLVTQLGRGQHQQVPSTGRGSLNFEGKRVNRLSTRGPVRVAVANPASQAPPAEPERSPAVGSGYNAIAKRSYKNRTEMLRDQLKVKQDGAIGGSQQQTWSHQRGGEPNLTPGAEPTQPSNVPTSRSTPSCSAGSNAASAPSGGGRGVSTRLSTSKNRRSSNEPSQMNPRTSQDRKQLPPLAGRRSVRATAANNLVEPGPGADKGDLINKVADAASSSITPKNTSSTTASTPAADQHGGSMSVKGRTSSTTTATESGGARRLLAHLAKSRNSGSQQDGDASGKGVRGMGSSRDSSRTSSKRARQQQSASGGGGGGRGDCATHESSLSSLASSPSARGKQKPRRRSNPDLRRDPDLRRGASVGSNAEDLQAQSSSAVAVQHADDEVETEDGGAQEAIFRKSVDAIGRAAHDQQDRCLDNDVEDGHSGGSDLTTADQKKVKKDNAVVSTNEAVKKPATSAASLYGGLRESGDKKGDVLSGQEKDGEVENVRDKAVVCAERQQRPASVGPPRENSQTASGSKERSSAAIQKSALAKTLEQRIRTFEAKGKAHLMSEESRKADKLRKAQLEMQKILQKKQEYEAGLLADTAASASQAGSGPMPGGLEPDSPGKKPARGGPPAQRRRADLLEQEDLNASPVGSFNRNSTASIGNKAALAETDHMQSRPILSSGSPPASPAPRVVYTKNMDDFEQESKDLFGRIEALRARSTSGHQLAGTTAISGAGGSGSSSSTRALLTTSNSSEQEVVEVNIALAPASAEQTKLLALSSSGTEMTTGVQGDADGIFTSAGVEPTTTGSLSYNSASGSTLFPRSGRERTSAVDDFSAGVEDEDVNPLTNPRISAATRRAMAMARIEETLKHQKTKSSSQNSSLAALEQMIADKQETKIQKTSLYSGSDDSDDGGGVEKADEDAFMMRARQRMRTANSTSRGK
ncbi:unnamed protein product [Amoebophrya sp. A25]|nr:unnamed protein product [Amoebophrya sp. A25]|eukprot:GSA25T00010796001.1